MRGGSYELLVVGSGRKDWNCVLSCRMAAVCTFRRHGPTSVAVWQAVPMQLLPPMSGG
jgi:hypothetical protein